jgi:hypothetical protein
MANKRISTTDLDFNQIKNNLKSFLQGQTEFQDYNFEGSSMSVLLDILAYNTHYNALYKNLAVNEMFLDSASKRSSVVSRAKEIGYIPSSATSSAAKLKLVFTPGTGITKPDILVLPANTSFTSSLNGTTYTFYTLQDYVTTIDVTRTFYEFNDVVIKEGIPLQYKYTVTTGQRFIIPNADADLSTLTVRVQENSTSGTFTSFINNENMLTVSGTDPVYFIKEIDGQLYELEFGNDVIGKAVNPGNVVTINYMVTNKSEPNGCRTFIYQGASLLGANPIITTLETSSGGEDIEDIESIRFNAPRAYATQNRAVTVEDYKTMITNFFPEAGSVAVWGGEDNQPPVYGKVYICVKPKTTNILSEGQKQTIIRDILKNKNVVTITPEIVDPSYIKLELETNVYFNSRATALSSSQIEILVRQTINEYNATYLNRFDGIFRQSKLSSLIDSTEESVVSNVTTIKLRRSVDVKYNLPSKYEIVLGNPIYNTKVGSQSILSTGFYIDGGSTVYYIEDVPEINSLNEEPTGAGKFKMFYKVEDKPVFYKNLGVIDYRNGTFSLESLNISDIEGPEFEFIIKSQSNDVASVRNQLVSIDPNLITVTVIDDKVSTGNAAGNTNYVFSSSRN